MLVSLFCIFVFSFVYSVILYCFVYCISLYIYICLFPIFVQVYRPLPPGGNPIALNKYHTIIRIRKVQGTNCARYSKFNRPIHLVPSIFHVPILLVYNAASLLFGSRPSVISKVSFNTINQVIREVASYSTRTDVTWISLLKPKKETLDVHILKYINTASYCTNLAWKFA
jgi:hypothetical protein